jgi:hypothetical protein
VRAVRRTMNTECGPSRDGVTVGCVCSRAAAEPDDRIVPVVVVGVPLAVTELATMVVPAADPVVTELAPLAPEIELWPHAAKPNRQQNADSAARRLTIRTLRRE